MINIFAIIAPIFLIVGAGYLCARGQLLPEATYEVLMRFAMNVAVPCLLFMGMRRLDLGAAFDWPVIFSFFVGAFICFGLAHTAARLLSRTPGEAVAIGFCAYFSNSVLLGVPIAERALGADNLESVFAIITFHAVTLYTFATVLMEVSRRDGAGFWNALKRASRSLSRNALVIAILLGVGMNLLTLNAPKIFDDAANMLAQSAVPVALFAMGGAMTRYKVQNDLGWAAGVSALVLLLHPAITWVLATQVFETKSISAQSAVIVAAMPSGLNIYVFASMYQRAQGVAASTVLLSTALSLFSVSMWLVFLGI